MEGNIQSAVRGVAAKRVSYAPDLFLADALGFIDQHKDGPFFLYYADTIPHANNERTRAESNGNEVPDLGQYADRDWPGPEKSKAAMISHLDANVGKLLEKIKKLNLDEHTIVFFSSDNGPHKEGGNDPRFFNSAGGLRGIKRDLYEGGIREPMIVRWPGHIAAGAVSDFPCAFWDLLPTCTDLAEITPPYETDGVSVLPTLIGKGEQQTHPYLYWEFHESGSKQAVRFGNWKAVRLKPSAAIELYDLRADVGEQNNVAARHPDTVAKVAVMMKEARTESAIWPLSDKPWRPVPSKP